MAKVFVIALAFFPDDLIPGIIKLSFKFDSFIVNIG